MPATLYVTHLAPLSAPLSRRDDAMVVPSSCQACGATAGADWIKADGVGILVHRSGERCPVSVPFDWATGKPLPAPALGAVAA